MKRMEMIDLLSDYMGEYFGDAVIGGEYRYLAEKLLTITEERGMLPPTNTCRLIPDEVRGGFRHSPTERKWDDEEV